MIASSRSWSPRDSASRQPPAQRYFWHASGEPVQLAIDPAFDPMVDRAELMDLGGIGVRVVTTADLISMKERAAADPGRRRSQVLRDQADIALLRGDIPEPDEGW